MLDYIKKVLENAPKDWLSLTTHRLDIYTERLAKTQFLEQFELLYKREEYSQEQLEKLPTAYDYIRLGHPLSSVLEWAAGKLYGLDAESIISFSSQTMPLLAILRTNSLQGKNTLILHTGDLPASFDAELLRRVYGYEFRLQKVADEQAIPNFSGSRVFVSQQRAFLPRPRSVDIDFFVNLYPGLGSLVLINNEEDAAAYSSAIQHVRRRESIAMTPANCLKALQSLAEQKPYTLEDTAQRKEEQKASVREHVQAITGTKSRALLASSGLSMQYAIMMGLVEHALEAHKGKDIALVVPPNCYGGTNDQARRVAACVQRLEIVDLPVDAGHDMVQSVEAVLQSLAQRDAVPYIIAEIPTNPRVEVPELKALEAALRKKRKTASGQEAVAPVFILDQTFCPNVQFLGGKTLLAHTPIIAYVSGSKFPSGGKCTAGYCLANTEAEALLAKIEKHLQLCDNEATALQVEILAEQLPSMNSRIAEAYKATRDFVQYIQELLPEAKINFVSEELAAQDFTPSVFSLDLPSLGSNEQEREEYKRALNQRLIYKMIRQIPEEAKFCVSYGQLKGSYWTVPATSTQGTTKESDKDYIVRVALSGNIDLEKHKAVFAEFVASLS